MKEEKAPLAQGMGMRSVMRKRREKKKVDKKGQERTVRE
jgi:hypothetical protein